MELRAIWFSLPQWDENSSSLQEQGKAQWRAGLKSKLDNQLYRLHKGTLSTQHQRHPVYHVSSASIDLCDWLIYDDTDFYIGSIMSVLLITIMIIIIVIVVRDMNYFICMIQWFPCRLASITEHLLPSIQ